MKRTRAQVYTRKHDCSRWVPPPLFPLFDPFDALTRWLSIASKLGNLSLSPHRMSRNLFPVSLLSTLLRYFLRHFEKMGRTRWLIFASLLVRRRFRNNDKYNFWMNFPKKRPVFCLLVEDYFLIGVRVFKYRKCSTRHVKLSMILLQLSEIQRSK